MKSAIYEVYRNGGDDLEDHLQVSITTFYERHGFLPGQVVVSPKVVGQTEIVLQSLALPNLAVRTTGGCLVGEVWLCIEEGNGNGKSLA